MNHDDDTCPHLVRANLLEAENARLKAEVERLTLENSQYEEHHKYGQNVITSLREELERLTKAGDAFYESEIGYYGEQILNDPKHHSGQMCRDWNAAKEGKGQP